MRSPVHRRELRLEAISRYAPYRHSEGMILGTCGGIELREVYERLMVFSLCRHPDGPSVVNVLRRHVLALRRREQGVDQKEKSRVAVRQYILRNFRLDRPSELLNVVQVENLMMAAA